MRLFTKLFTGLSLLFLGGSLWAAGKASHVVVVVWDGMRPDFVSQQTTPVLFALAHRGVTFTNHHSAYITSTEVNGAALATGMFPGESGVIGNKEFRPGVNPSGKLNTGDPEDIRRDDAATENHFLRSPTVAEILHQYGFRTAIAGAKTIALLHDRFPRADDSPNVNVFEGNSLPPSFAQQLTNVLGPFPPAAVPKTARDLWTTRALTDVLWEKDVPPFSLLWLSEPDNSQHETGLGSQASLNALRSSDDNLGRVLAALKKKKALDQTDIIVVSDHGFSTIQQNTDVAAVLNTNGFHAFRQLPSDGSQADGFMVVGNGGSVFLYALGQHQQLVEKAVHFLQSQPFCGMVFTRQRVEGALLLQDAKINSPDAPDIVLSMRWSSEKNTNGVPGMVFSDYGSYGPGRGIHASLSPFDLHNLGIAAGPDFRKKFRDPLPTGNIDIAPTILWLLDVQPTRPMSGRVLTEALVGPQPEPSLVKFRHSEAIYQSDKFTWQERLDFADVNGAVYFDGGCCERRPTSSAAGN